MLLVTVDLVMRFVQRALQQNCGSSGFALHHYTEENSFFYIAGPR